MPYGIWFDLFHNIIIVLVVAIPVLAVIAFIGSLLWCHNHFYYATDERAPSSLQHQSSSWLRFTKSLSPKYYPPQPVFMKYYIFFYACITEVSAYRYTPRLFYMSSVSGVFEATEILNMSRSPDVISAFPFLQSDLYKASQPGLYQRISGNCLQMYTVKHVSSNHLSETHKRSLKTCIMDHLPS